MKSTLPLQFEYIEDIEPPNRGFQLDIMKAILDGNEVGYLKVEYVPRAKFEHFTPTIFHYFKDFEGWTGVKCTPGIQPDLEDIEFWAELIHYSRSWPSSYSKTGNVPSVEKRLIHIQKIAKSYQEKFDRYIDYHVGKPKVGYIRVKEEFQRKGIAIDLYEMTARKLATMGFDLRASTLQQAGATAAWDYMLANRYPIHKEKTRYMESPFRYVLSYL